MAIDDASQSDDPMIIADPSGAGKLTPREVEVLHLVSLGWETAKIAEELGVSEHTVLNHIRNFRQKLDAQNKLQAVIAAVRLGILKWQ
ncbi:response regulator transcription factor [Candidatus Poriferisocius sp.]|uniref:response regulator transcription factor n=1 Tax=Candidatus Poriferisocius sp. TaxID=3101276 RepID=UPI003B013F45